MQAAWPAPRGVHAFTTLRHGAGVSAAPGGFTVGARADDILEAFGSRVEVQPHKYIEGGRYLVLANHRSWVDIPVLQKVFNRRIPLLRFFLKRQLVWVPVLGLCWWALDFPFMQRATKSQLARRPELAGRDLAATRRACEKFRHLPVSIMNFVEGTRFTPAKHASQGSSYRHLLRPKAGGAAFVLGAMGDALDGVLDVTVHYDLAQPSLADRFADRIRTVRVRVVERPIPEGFVGADYEGDRDYRRRFQAWLNQMWIEKDLCLQDWDKEVSR